jgi:hypothetical protein
MARRAGTTVKLSISLDAQDAAFLRKRARRLSGGNVSAAIADLVRALREHEGREALAAWLAEGQPELTEERMNEIRAEWRGEKARRRRKKAA